MYFIFFSCLVSVKWSKIAFNSKTKLNQNVKNVNIKSQLPVLSILWSDTPREAFPFIPDVLCVHLCCVMANAVTGRPRGLTCSCILSFAQRVPPPFNTDQSDSKRSPPHQPITARKLFQYVHTSCTCCSISSTALLLSYSCGNHQRWCRIGV